jgi:glycosyltransferase involved in cell wall biosynthesis
MITALTVNYNTPDYLERLLTSFRKFYPDLPYLVIDGSSEENYKKIKNFDKKFGIQLIHFNYNIHHGPGMTYGIKQIKTDQALFVDSDMIIYNGGWLEMMEKELRKDSYGIGDIQKEFYLENKTPQTPVTIDRIRAQRRRMDGRRLPALKTSTNTIKIWVDYLHPVFTLVNKNVMLKYPLPEKGYGAPFILAMKQIHLQNQGHLLQRAQWLIDDLHLHKQKYVQHNSDHNGMGTIKTTGGYHYV